MSRPMPAHVAEARAEICAGCPVQCEAYKARQIDHGDPSAACGVNWPVAWGRYGLGLGDAVHAVAQPVAAVIDAVAGTNVKGCGGCQKRREGLNRAVPNVVQAVKKLVSGPLQGT